MNKNECLEKLDEIAGYEDNWCELGGHAFSKCLIERCRRMVGKMRVAPNIMPTVEDEICFQFDTEEIGVEIAVSRGEISCFVSDREENYSFFVFGDELDAVNFWNTVVGKFAGIV